MCLKTLPLRYALIHRRHKSSMDKCVDLWTRHVHGRNTTVTFVSRIHLQRNFGVEALSMVALREQQMVLSVSSSLDHMIVERWPFEPKRPL